MANMECSVEEPDVCFHGYCTNGYGAVERNLSPIVVVTVDELWYDALG